ncbi:hypothetical protein EDC01DRAFT_483385 [Geopyxis carbonaria]|nr:hypothetical protein EDC01DRAFT_483385 [Geopyxis carbonaria]
MTTQDSFAEKDVGAIGQHCDLEYCHRLDFLPFVCESCKKTFCLDHRTETAHKCSNEGAWLASKRPAATTSSSSSSTKPQNLLAAPCAVQKCKTIINTPRDPGVNCTTCRKQYCLAHRLQDSHDCKPPPPPATTIAGDKAKDALRRFKLWTSSKNEAVAKKGGSIMGARKTGTGGVAEVLKMKKEAKGDEKIPADKRIYLYVEAEAKTTTSKLPKGVFYYSKEWSVGRVLDVAARGLQVQNVNSQADSEEKRLRIFHVEGGRVLNFGEKIGDCTVNGNTIVMLRGLQMPDLLGD